MIKNKFVLIILLTLVFSLKGIALDSSYKNSLEEINIKKTSGGHYTINLLFNKAYTEPLSIQKKTSDSYSIILPETQISTNNVKIIYKDGKDKIKLKVNEYPYLDQSINNGYVKITATTLDRLSLKVASDIKLLPKAEKINPKNIEIIQKENPQNVSPAKTPAEKSKEENPPTSPEEIPIIDSGTNPIQTNIKNTKNDLSPDYLDALMKISLVLFLILVTLRQLYKAFKPSKTDKQPKPTATDYEDDKAAKSTSKNPRPKSQFEVEVERLSEKEVQQNCHQETIIKTKFESEIVVEKLADNEDDFEDEDFDYDFDFEEEEEDKETADSSIPKLISTAPIDKNKGFYLVKYDGQTSLIGYIGDEIFVINKFDKIYNSNLQTRLNERKKNKSNYLVRIDNYKALIEVSENNMQVLIEF